MAQSGKTYVIWCITDGKLGHMKQVQGLVRALGRQLAVTVVDIRAASARRTFIDWLSGRFPQGAGLPPPDLIVGAGHATHMSMLAAQRIHGGKTVVLMKPSLPRWLFDLCLIPEHDEVTPGANVLVTHGALNPVQPSDTKNAEAGLILLGGPSRHYHWNESKLVADVRHLIAGTPKTQWKLTTSPRTPITTIQALRATHLLNLEIVPYSEAPADWLTEELERAGLVWVTPDSVSMVYEALTSGASVGVFDLPKRSSSRVVRGLERLASKGWVLSYQHWRAGASLSAPIQKLDEASRCAFWIKKNWFQAV